MGYVYKITNTINGKAYIGISVHEPEKRRIKDHLSGRGNRVIANAVKKYGKDAFTYEILEANVFDEFLPDLEVAYITNHNTIAPDGYNLDSGGSHAKPSVETRRKISASQKGKKRKPLSIEHRRKLSKAFKGEKHPFFGKKHSAETRRKMSEAHKNPSAETRRKMSEAHKGMTGKKHSAETRRKISDANKGKKRSAKTRRKLSESHKGKTHSAETRRKISEISKGRNHSAETRRKLSESHKGKKHSVEHRRKNSESKRGKKNHNFGKRKPDYAPARVLFFSLPSDMSLTEKRKRIYTRFSNVNERTVRNWVREWIS